MSEQIFGRLSLSEENKLLLDGTPIEEGQLLIVQHGEGKLIGRAELHKKTGWVLDTEEFYGHTYLNIPLNAEFFDDLRAKTGTMPTCE